MTEHRPDAVIADIRMPPTHTDDGLRAAVAVRRDFPSIGVLLFSQYIETRYTARLLETGAGGIGYLLKDRVGNVAEFVSALERVAAGGTALDPEVISQLLRKPDPGLASLTPRERDVLGVMAEGKSNPVSPPSSCCPKAPWRSTSPASSASCPSNPNPPPTAAS